MTYLKYGFFSDVHPVLVRVKEHSHTLTHMRIHTHTHTHTHTLAYTRTRAHSHAWVGGRHFWNDARTGSEFVAASVVWYRLGLARPEAEFQGGV